MTKLASLNFMLSVSEYDAINATTNKLQYLSARNGSWLHAHVQFLNSQLFPDSDLSDCLPHRVKRRTDAVNNLSQCRETCTMLKIIL